MDSAKYYFPNGCTECGHEIIFQEQINRYLCIFCGVSAKAHKHTSEHAKANEPYQYLANDEINDLRSELEDLFEILWRSKIEIQRKGKIRKESFINIVFPQNIRTLDEDGEDKLVRVVYFDVHKQKYDVYVYETACVKSNIPIDKLSPVHNKNKVKVWLASELKLPVDECRIGYLSKEDLEKSILLCRNSIENSRELAHKSITKNISK